MDILQNLINEHRMINHQIEHLLDINPQHTDVLADTLFYLRDMLTQHDRHEHKYFSVFQNKNLFYVLDKEWNSQNHDVINQQLSSLLGSTKNKRFQLDLQNLLNTVELHFETEETILFPKVREKSRSADLWTMGTQSLAMFSPLFLTS